MRTIYNPNQISLFDDAVAPVLEAAVLPAVHDIAELHRMIELVDGEPRILDTRLGTWLGFKDPLDARQGIRRSPMMRELSALGILAQRELNSFRRGRPTIGFLLNQAQVNHYITHCGLPNLSALRVLATKVFTAHQAGHLAPTNAATEIALQDAAEAAEAQKPGSATLGAEMARMARKVEVWLNEEHDFNATQFAEIKELFTQLGPALAAVVIANVPRPKEEFSEATRTAIFEEYLRQNPTGLDPLGTTIIFERDAEGNPLPKLIKGIGELHHMRGRYCNGVGDGLPVTVPFHRKLTADVSERGPDWAKARRAHKHFLDKYDASADPDLFELVPDRVR